MWFKKLQTANNTCGRKQDTAFSGTVLTLHRWQTVANGKLA